MLWYITKHQFPGKEEITLHIYTVTYVTEYLILAMHYDLVT
jgi:hypothetical protein